MFCIIAINAIMLEQANCIRGSTRIKQHARHRYPCDKCDYVEGDEYVLNTHIESQNFTKRHGPSN